MFIFITKNCVRSTCSSTKCALHGDLHEEKRNNLMIFFFIEGSVILYFEIEIELYFGLSLKFNFFINNFYFIHCDELKDHDILYYAPPTLVLAGGVRIYI